MINKKYILGIMIAAQIFIPVNMIFQQERVLRKGAVYRFKTAPVDPYDVLRGRYVALSVESNSVECKENDKIGYGQVVYALLGKDKDGYAVIKDIAPAPWPNGDYIKTKVSYKRKSRLYLDLPFSRFYMNEYKASRAEDLYRKYNRRDDKDKRGAYILVRVLEGRAAIVDLYLDEKPILSYFN